MAMITLRCKACNSAMSQESNDNLCPVCLVAVYTDLQVDLWVEGEDILTAVQSPMDKD